MIATAVAAVVAVIPVLAVGVPGMHTAAQYSWFIGCGLAFALYCLAMRNSPVPAIVAEQEPVEAV